MITSVLWFLGGVFGLMCCIGMVGVFDGFCW